jgi:RNA-binding protein
VITTKQRAYLKSLAMTMDPIYQIGKSMLTPEITEGVSEALEARELVKINVLKSCMVDLHELADMLADRTQSEVVQVIGRKIVLYRESKNKKRIILPEARKK